MIKGSNMQSLKVISVNIWAILASLANLLLLTWIVKKFLFKPVKKIVDARRAAIDADYEQAAAARAEAEENRLNYEAAMAAAEQTSGQIIADATRIAEHRSNEIVAEAREKATELRRQAEADAVLEMPDGEWIAVEVKLGVNQEDSAAKNLLDLRRLAHGELRGAR